MTLQTTCLGPIHRRLGARMAPFGGFEMPIQYAGILAEHRACREGAVCFDTCHMGEFRVEGHGAVRDLERLLTCEIGSLETGQCRYGLMCNPGGGVIDDLLVYRLADTVFMLVVNAGTRAGDFEWVNSHCSDDTQAFDLSDETAKIDLQGPRAPAIAHRLLDAAVENLPWFRFRPADFAGSGALLSRTGYTGEIGFEFYGTPDQAIAFWNACLELGAEPAGLGARDTLRLEMGMPLYGHELAADRNAGTAGLNRAIAPDKDFIGADAVRGPQAGSERLVGIALESRRAARAGDTVRGTDGTMIGMVTSGSYGPSIGTAIAMAYVAARHAAPGTEVGLGRSDLPGHITRTPFWPNGTARFKLGSLSDKQ